MAMNLVTREHLERWADTPSSKSTLPYLISRLVRATTPTSTTVDIPWGSATYIGGWDGIVNCEAATAYVPKGVSLWEFGTNVDCKGKADGDYDKRKSDPLGFTPGDCAFIFVTPRLWTKKDEWIAAKKAENHWKDVIVYDSTDLEQWLDRAPAVARWFASWEDVNACPFDGIMTADEYWEEWSTGPSNFSLLPECVIAGRETEKEKLLSALRGEPSLKWIKASTKSEATAFIIATLKTSSEDEAGRFFSRALVVDTEGNFREMSNNYDPPLILIPRFCDNQPFNVARKRGHHVLVPLGADEDLVQDQIVLPRIDRDGQIESLIESGVPEDEAERFSRESGRDITILKEFLGFPPYRVKWNSQEDIRELIPALLLGRWNEAFTGDIELIEKLSGQKYNDYLTTLNRWKFFEGSPIIQSGKNWRLTSPLSLWRKLVSQLMERDLDSLRDCFSLAFKNGNPIIESQSIFSRRKYSNWSRGGLVQSLILVGQKGVSSNSEDYQDWVDRVISDLLEGASGELWLSLDQELPLIAEAAPDAFLEAVKRSLENQQPEIMDMFREEDDFISKTSHHTGLLWALEGLAWLPEYLGEVSGILLKLSNLDPGGSLANRPINSFVEIFKPWHYQTLASFEERMQILERVANEEEFAWTLLIRMLPNGYNVAFPTHKMRWRLFDENTSLSYSYKEMEDTYSNVIAMLISIVDNDEDKISQLIRKVPELSVEHRKRILDWADEVLPTIKQEKVVIWKTIREILHRHRSVPGASWALPESELVRFESLYQKLEPTDIILRYTWLFDNKPLIPEGDRYDTEEYEELQQRIDDKRKSAIEELRKSLDLGAIVELRDQVEDPQAFGRSLAQVITERDEILVVCQCLKDTKERFIHGFIREEFEANGFEWIKSLFQDLRGAGMDSRALSNILIPLNQNRDVWSLVSSQDEEVQKEYWENIDPYFCFISDDEGVFRVEMLLKHKNFVSAVDSASFCKNVIPSILLVKVLKGLLEENVSVPSSLLDYEVEQIFEELDKRTDVERSALLELERLYLPILSRDERRGAKVLEEELANNPNFFIEVLRCLYKSTDESLLKKEQENLSEEEIRNRATRAFKLLNSWKKVPGTREDNSIDESELRDWVYKARALARTVGRLEIADEEIGKVLARYPEDSPSWPEEKIFRIIEEINSEKLEKGYFRELRRKRSFSVRGVFDGGSIERANAAYFEKLENDFRGKYPNVSKVFRRLKKYYLWDGKRMDENAEIDKLEY